MSDISEATDKIMNSMSEEGKNAAYRLMALSTRKAILEKYRDEAIPDTDEENMLKDLLSGNSKYNTSSENKSAFALIIVLLNDWIKEIDEEIDKCTAIAAKELYMDSIKDWVNGLISKRSRVNDNLIVKISEEYLTKIGQSDTGMNSLVVNGIHYFMNSIDTLSAEFNKGTNDN